MNKLNIFLIIMAFSAVVVGCSDKGEIPLCVQLDPLEKVLKEQIYFVENNDTAAAAKGETVSFQFVVRSIYPIKNLKVEAGNLVCGNQQIPAGLKAFVGYVRQGRATPNPSRDRLVSASDMFPDPLIEEETMDVSSMSNQPVWISYDVPKDSPAGIYSAEVVISGKVQGKTFRIRKKVAAKIFNVVLPEQTLYTTNWFVINTSTGGDANDLKPGVVLDNLSYMNNGEPVAVFSDLYWQLVKTLANTMRDFGQNVYMLSPLKLCKYNISGTNYTFDFTNFDQTVEFFMKEGNLKLIEGEHIAHRITDWSSLFGVDVPFADGAIRTLPFENDTAQLFMSQFFPALYQHIKSKGWDKIYIQHIADEPIRENVDSYIQIAETVKKMMPGIRIIEANHSREVENTIDIWVPQLDFFHSDYKYYQERQAAGDEVWYYTCLAPQGNYANWFIELPLIKTRILYWLNYRYGATGFLHAGYNKWWRFKNGEAAYIFEEGGNILPGGDTFIIYPAYRKVNISIRLVAVRDGIRDYELLKLLEKKYPDQAKEIARTVVYNFDRYDCNVKSFREKRIKILTLLSE